MYCRQCEQTAKSVACTVKGVCGKPAEVAGLLDVLLYGLVGIAVFEKRRRELGIKDFDTDMYIMEGLFATITNVDFDQQRISALIRKGYTVKEKVKNSFLKAYKDKTGQDFKDIVPPAADWKPADTIEEMLQQSAAVGIQSYPAKNDDVRSLKEILLYGIKGMAAYADHASILGMEDETVLSFFSKALCAVSDPDIESQALISLIMEFGKINLRCMEILDSVHTKTFGDPVPTTVFRGVKKGPAIIVSGHDLKDLRDLLEQTKGSGINIYTHGEMLPAHGYPELHKYNHLVGHFGTAWQNQQKEFDGIPAVILMTTNCIQEPKPSYK
ncbi:MAG: hydroxylamine reductase, partial [Candidatus Omnitrophica bacterium]|nr:hydroxylamine reductase [Candidatus Omnitrophota bacterium]